MKAYISVSFSKRKLLDDAIRAIISVLDQCKVEPFVFVDRYRFTAGQEQQMMQQAMLDIDHSDLLIAETSDKAIGIGIEVGYAKAKGKPVIYLRQRSADHSTTTAGISDFQVIYDDMADLVERLQKVLHKLSAAYQALQGQELVNNAVQMPKDWGTQER